MTRVLVVDDEAAIRDAVSYSLRAEGLDVEGAEDGAGALAALAAQSFDLVLLDVMLGDVSGVEVCRRIRAVGDVPVLMLTARDSEADLVLGFEAGADDYVTKPFSTMELISRVRAILRRRELDRGSKGAVLTAGDVRLDLLRHEVTAGSDLVAVTPTEFRLLALLAEEDRPYTRRELLSAIWETPFVPDDRSCDVHVANIRRKIGSERVLTVRGVGYRLARS